MDVGLKGRRALITGASKGIGKAVAQGLADSGCDVVLVARSIETLERCKAELEAGGAARVSIVAADFSISSEIDRVAEAHPDIDILVNNAGAIPPGDLLARDEAQWRAAWDLKLWGYINATRAYYRLMQARGSGVIINIIGAAAISRYPNYIWGATANAALDAFTRSLGSTSHTDGIRVVGIHPGAIATERLQALGQNPAMLKNLPFGRAGQSTEIANAVTFLASDLSAYTSGTVLTIDGGMTGSGG